MRDPSDTDPTPLFDPALAARTTPVVLGELTTEEAFELLRRGDAVALVPIGSTEPHGPHLPLATDVILSDEACRRAAHELRKLGRPALVAPSVAYGVTRYALGFRGVVGVSEETLVALLGDIGRALLDDGFAHVAFVNNHLEPAHVAAISRAVSSIADERGPACVSFPDQLTRRWGRTLTDEFKRGDCHAGRYETSLVLAARKELVRSEAASLLPPLDISLARAIREGGGRPVTFRALGMERAYTGAPAEASALEGEDTYRRLVEMIVAEIAEHFQDAGEATSPHPLADTTAEIPAEVLRDLPRDTPRGAPGDVPR